jgi:hypothetical protein
MGVYEWTKDRLFRQASKGENSFFPLSFETDSSALANQVEDGFKIQTFDPGLDDFSDKTADLLSGREVQVFSGDQKLFNTSLSAFSEEDASRLGKNEFQLFFERFTNPSTNDFGQVKNNFDRGQNFRKLLPENVRSGLPENVHTLKDVFQATGINNLTLKPVQDKVPDNFEGSLPGPDKVKEKTESMSLGLILPVVAVVGLIYVVIFR